MRKCKQSGYQKVHAKQAYIEFLIETFSPLGEITARAMFGGHTLYCNGVVFALVANNTLYLKADDHNRPDFEALDLEAFRPFPDRPETMRYYRAPAELFDSLEGVEKWAGGAVEAGRRAGRKENRSKGKKRRTNP